MTRRLLLALCAAQLWSAAAAIPAGFDCAQAVSPAERLVCENGYLAFLDQKLAAVYKEALEKAPRARRGDIREGQRSWLTNREACAAPDCLIAAYDQRLRELEPEEQDLAVYRDSEYGFELRYPKTMRVSTTTVTHYHVNSRWQQKARAAGTALVSVVVYRPNGDADYPDVEVRVGAHFGKTPEEACEWPTGMKSPFVLHDGSFSLEGRKFEVFDLANAGMSQSIDGYSFQTFHNGACYAVESFVTDSSLGLETSKGRAAARVTRSFYLRTYEIARSFRFLGP